MGLYDAMDRHRAADGKAVVLRILLLAGLLLLPAAWAAAGDSVFQFGWAHIRPQESNGAPHHRLRSNPLFPALGIEESFRSESVEVRAPDVDTLALILKHFLTDHWAINLTLGIPRKAGLEASGTVGPTGPTGPLTELDIGRDRFNPIASARQWSPILLIEYHFRDPGAAWRPFLAVGGSYTFFTEVELNERFEAAVNSRFGTPLAVIAGRPGPTDTDADIAPTLAAAFSAGFTVTLSSRWSLTTSATYLPLETTGKATLEAADGTRLATSRTRLRFDPVVFGLLAGYRF